MTDVTQRRVQKNPAPTRSTKETLIASGMGNALEWYDWGIYSSFAIYFATEVFNPDDKVASLLGAMAVFAVGFVARPVGGWLFGWMADHFGRRMSMIATVGLATLGSLLIAIDPTHATAGLWAAAILLIDRLMQGLAHGGEMPTAQTYIAEAAPPQRRGLWSSLIYISGTSGIVIGLIMGVVLDAILTGEAMATWGWRIPFAIGAVLGLCTLIARSRLQETSTFENAADKSRMWPEVRRNWRSALQVILLGVGGTVCYYVWSVSAVQQAVLIHGMQQGTALLASVSANVLLIISLPFWGMFSDRFGRRPAMIIGIGVPILLYIPLEMMLGSSFWSLFIPASLILVFMGAVLANTPAVFAEMFPTRVRTIGVAVPYSISVALFGGTAPYLQSWMNTEFGAVPFTTYVIVLMVISIIASFKLIETRGKMLTD